MARQLIGAFRGDALSAPEDEPLSKREKDLLRLVAEGCLGLCMKWLFRHPYPVYQQQPLS